jgi:hypothetical protein
VIVYAVVDDAISPDFPLGDAVEVFVRSRGFRAVRRRGPLRRARWQRSSGSRNATRAG